MLCMLFSYCLGLFNLLVFEFDRWVYLDFDLGVCFVYLGVGINLLQFVFECGFGFDVDVELCCCVFQCFDMCCISMMWQQVNVDNQVDGIMQNGELCFYLYWQCVVVVSFMDMMVEDYVCFVVGFV